MTQSVDFVLLSDLHVSHRLPADAGLLTDTSAALEEAIARIEALETPPAFVIIAGDLTNHGEPDAYRKLVPMLDRLSAPKILALGNHDTRPGFRSVMLEGDGDPDAPYLHELVVSGVHVIVLDSSLPGRISGALGTDQIDFLTRALANEPALPKLVVCHHPPHLDVGEAGWHSLDAESSERLGAAVRGGKVAAILSGHVHCDSIIHWHGVPVVIGTGLHNAIDPTERSRVRMLDSAGFTLCRLRPSGLAVSFVPLPRGGAELAVLDADWLNTMDRRGAEG